MIKRNINKIEKIEGENIFVFQYIDANGNASEERKSLDTFLVQHPLVVEKEKRITTLEANNQLLIENKGLLNEKVIRQSQELAVLEQEKERLEKELTQFLIDMEGKDLQQTSTLYQEAFDLFMQGDIQAALVVLDDAKLEEIEQKIAEERYQQAETRLLKAQMLRTNHDYHAAAKNYEKAVQLETSWGNCLTTANYFKYVNEFPKAEYYYQLCLLNAKEEEEKATTLNNLANLQRAKNEFEKAEQSYEEALAIYRKLAEVNPQTYLPDVGMTLNNLAVLQSDKNEFEKAEQSYEEALAIRRKLAEVNPQTYLPDLAMTQINMSLFYQTSKIDKSLSLQLIEEAITNLLPFHQIRYIQNYLRVAFQILKAWDIDVEAYLAEKIGEKNL